MKSARENNTVNIMNALSLRIEKRQKRIKLVKTILVGTVTAIGLFMLLTVGWVLYYKFFNPSVTNLMVQRSQQAEQQNRNFRIQFIWCPYDKISIYLKQSAIMAEDASFLQHRGFNFRAIKMAYLKNKELGSNTYGGSTISQQTAKNLFLWNGRSWFRKLVESYFTVLIELLWDKKRILEVYLNIVEYGDGVFGAEAAAKKYFNTSALTLNRTQASLLAVVLPSPLKFSIVEPSQVLIEKSYRNLMLIDLYEVPNGLRDL